MAELEASASPLGGPASRRLPTQHAVSKTSDVGSQMDMPQRAAWRHRNVRRAAALLAVLSVLPGHLSLSFCPGLPNPDMDSRLEDSVARLQRRHLFAAPAALGFGLVAAEQPEAARAMSAVVAADIKRAAKGLNELVESWDKDIQVEDRLTEGANIAREKLMIKYTQDFIINVPAGEKIGIQVNPKCYVASVQRPQLGWVVDDFVFSVNNIELQRSAEYLEKYVKRAQEKEIPLKFYIVRTYPALLDNLEKKLQDIYVTVDDDSALPDLEEMQLKIGEIKVLATSAASGTTVSYVIMNRFREAVKQLRDKIVPVAQAIV
mmetsp:Transcript_31264/g.72915  ORF Transcript_31264/g.72915 Transcript_31264/m.72915 type:complete len:319 (+) Transcript_31264:96-1052(+)